MSDHFAHNAVAELEMRIATTPAEGLHGLVVKLGLHNFLSDHADATSLQCVSAYSDLVRLTGHDPASDIVACASRGRFEPEKLVKRTADTPTPCPSSRLEPVAATSTSTLPQEGAGDFVIEF